MSRVTIDSLNIVATWKFKVENKNCPLCRNNLMAPTQADIDNKDIKNVIKVGKCKHAYHSVCIDKWLKNSNVSCVTCKTEWKPEKTVSSSVYQFKNIHIPVPKTQTVLPQVFDDFEEEKDDNSEIKGKKLVTVKHKSSIVIGNDSESDEEPEPPKKKYPKKQEVSSDEE